MSWLIVNPFAAGFIFLMAIITAVNMPIAGVYGDRGFPLRPRLIPTLVVALEPLLIYLVPRAPHGWQTPLAALILVGWLIGENKLVHISNKYYTKIVAPSAIAQPTP